MLRRSWQKEFYIIESNARCPGTTAGTLSKSWDRETKILTRRDVPGSTEISSRLFSWPTLTFALTLSRILFLLNRHYLLGVFVRDSFGVSRISRLRVLRDDWPIRYSRLQVLFAFYNPKQEAAIEFWSRTRIPEYIIRSQYNYLHNDFHSSIPFCMPLPPYQVPVSNPVASTAFLKMQPTRVQVLQTLN